MPSLPPAKRILKASVICDFYRYEMRRLCSNTDLQDYLENNRLIAHYCGFDITKPLPSYWTYDRFVRQLDNEILREIMRTQVKKLIKLGITDTAFIGLDSTPIAANTSHNNPKSFRKNKFKKDNQPKSDTDCRLGVHTASNQHLQPT